MDYLIVRPLRPGRKMGLYKADGDVVPDALVLVVGQRVLDRLESPQVAPQLRGDQGLGIRDFKRPARPLARRAP